MKYNKNTFSIVLNMAIPAIIESFFVSFAGFVDSMMVSTLGAESVAAVGLTTQPKFMGLAIFIAINVSLSALVARRFGQKDRKSANSILYTAIILIFILTIIISSVCVSFAPEILRFCGTTNETHDNAVLYYRIIMAGMLFNCIQMGINSAQRGAGNTKITMRTNLVSNSVNIVFNYLLIGGKFGFPRLGIAGAALATVLGTVVSSIISIFSIMKKDCFISIRYIIREKIKPSFVALKNIIQVGYSVFFEQMLLRIGFMMTALMAADQGTGAMAAHQVAMNTMSLTFAFGDGLQSAAVALIGRSLGEKNPDKAKEYGGACQFIGGIISVALAVIYFSGAKTVMGWFFKEREIIDIGVGLMKMVIITVLFQVRQVIYMGSLRGAGDTLFTAIVSASSVTIMRTATSYIFGYVLGFGIYGVWAGILADQFARCIAATLRFRAGKWIHIKI